MKNINTLSGLSVANFSKQIDGKETALYTLCNKVGRIDHIAGDQMYVDFAGDKLYISDRKNHGAESFQSGR